MKSLKRIVWLGVLVACGDGTGPESTPFPSVTDVSPAVIPSGSAPVTLVVTGQGFIATSRIFIDGAARGTTLQGSTLSTVLQASELSVPRFISLTVQNPAPGGGVSGAAQIVVSSPAPAIDSLRPAQLVVGGQAVTVVVSGQRFLPSSVVQWNGSDRPTRFISDQQLEADLSSADLAVAASTRLAVANPPLEGGTTALSYAVHNEQPNILSISPGQASMGSAGFTLSVTGERFVPGAVVLWNGARRPTTWLGPDRLTAAIPASDLAGPDSVAVSVENPAPAIGPSSDSTFRIQPVFVLGLHAWDLAWDAVRGLLYASMASDDVQYPDAIVAIDPVTGQVVAQVAPGVGPHHLAISEDASVLYVALDGEAQVARIDLATFTTNLKFPVGNGAVGTQWAGDIEVLPGSPGTLAVARITPAWRPSQDGVALYDDGVIRPVATPTRVGGITIEFTSATTLYGYNNEDSGFQLYRMSVSDSGLTVLSATEGLVEGYPTDIRSGAGYIFATSGTVVDAATSQLAATLPVLALACPEPSGGRVYYMTHTTLYAFDTATWTFIGAEPSPPVPSWYSVMRWGQDGFAYVGPNEVVVFRSGLVR